jgi:hypothetical protein
LFLTREEEKMLKGDYGPAVALAMKLLVTLGEVFEADRLVKIKSAQVSGVSYKNIGDAGLEFIEDLAKMGAKIRAYTTLNPAGMDLKRWKELGINAQFARKQLQIITAFNKIGIKPTCTCTPYLTGNKPKTGEHLAWAESSAVVFANSVLGAKTNREGGPSALASAITGVTPLYSYHLDANRKPTHLIQTEGGLRGELEFSALGYTVGKISGKCTPLFMGLGKPSLEELKALGAGLAASGSIALYHIDGVTPEAKRISEKERRRCEKIVIEDRDIRNTIRQLSVEEELDFVCLGCPHCSLSELKRAAALLSRKKVERKYLWIFTSDYMYKRAARLGYVKRIENSGGLVVRDTCMVVSPIEKLGINGVLTNSCKAAHYIPSTCGLPVRLQSFEDCIRTAAE